MRIQMQDDAFHEIQLNGKQLVFLFMAATVVAVVIFLCGVMVGRGVPQRAGNVTEVPIEAALDPTASPPTTSSSSTTSATPLTSGETLTYTERLEEPTPPAETLKATGEGTAATSSVPSPASAPVAEKARPVAAAPSPRAPSAVEGAPPAAKPAPAATAVPAAASKEPAGAGFVVQVAAVKERGEADTIARRLTTKGYPAFVTTAPGGVQMFRVRVGKFPDRREAESIAGRLQKEEQFKPWITR